MHRPISVLLLLIPLIASAQESSSGPLFMKHLLGDREFFEPWGVGVDYFAMEQDYKIQSLQFDLGRGQSRAEIVKSRFKAQGSRQETGIR